MYSPSLLRLTGVLPCALAGLLAAAAQNSTNYWPWQTYKSSAAAPPLLNISKSGPTSPGYLFFDQNGDYAHQYSLFIMTDDNELVWQSPVADYSAFRAQTFEGRPVLTFMNGITLSEPYGFGHGIIQLLDDSYESIYNVSLTAAEEHFVTIPELNATELYSYLDMHEALITPQDTILVTEYNITQTDLSSIGGPVDGWVADSLFYELDIKTNDVLFRWSALDHLSQIPFSDEIEFKPLGDSGKNQSIPYGFFHINSVDKFEDGSYLISSRYYCSIFRVSRDGTIGWTLQGQTGGDFKLGDGASFCYQHDARILHEEGTKLQISLFDNANSNIVSGVDQTRGLYLTLDTATGEATLDQAFFDPHDTVYARSQGNTQTLPDGHVVMGYGSTPKIREYNPAGVPVMTAQFGPGDSKVFSYRAYKLPWVGRPKTAPDVFACIDGARNHTQVYMSWNGATEHAAWEVLTGAAESSLTRSARVRKTGFETMASVPGLAAYVQVEAHGKNGTLMASSSVIVPQGSC
ncbi:ASST-domain-containing protein [Nemania sp. FL0031]|nr:ASST-domain-containing protein [Nemania sp. FL0031]